jgi:hypothetical protein
MSREITNQLVTDCRNFFWDLIDRTGTYFLSDYVEEIIDYVGEEECREICAKRDELFSVCKQHAVDFHGISCDVSNEFLHSQRGGMTPKEVCDELLGAGDLIEGMLTHEEREQDHIKRMQLAIDEAVNLIRTHVINDDDNQLPPPPSEIYLVI